MQTTTDFPKQPPRGTGARGGAPARAAARPMGEARPKQAATEREQASAVTRRHPPRYGAGF
jgi:hypothetical protein